MAKRTESSCNRPQEPVWETQTVSQLPRAAGAQRADTTRETFGRGTCLGRYVVLSLLGHGGMGNIYEAYDPELDRKVALKVLRQEALGTEQSQEAQLRLTREAQAIARLNHPNVVKVYDVGAVGDRVFVAMELIAGMNVDAWLALEARSWREALDVFLAAGRGLGAAHAAGLVHRDFKPGNVMVTTEGQVLVVDFGLARATVPGPAAAVEPGEPNAASRPVTPLTLTGQALGTPAYMAPEQYRGNQGDARADQFSFCVALYEALYGELPFTGDSLAELRQAVERGEVRAAPARTRIPAWVRRALLRGLAPDPADRFTDLGDLLAALSRDPVTPRKRWLAAAALLGLAVFLAVVVRSPSEPGLLCKGAGRKLQGIWDAPRKRQIEQVFLASDLAYAGVSWRRVEKLLDSYAGAWVATHTEACEATRLRGEQSEEMLDLVITCLDARLRELRTATGLLAEVDAEVVRNAVRVARSPAKPAACTDLTALTRGPRPDDATAVLVEEVRGRFFEAKAREVAGKYQDAMEIIRESVAVTDEIAYQPLVAEGRLRLATIQGRTGQVGEMRESLLQSVEIAQASHADRTLAQAFNYLILTASLAGAPEEAEIWARLAESAIARLGGDADLAADRHFFLGMVAARSRQPRKAIEHYETFLDLRTRSGSYNGPRHAYLNMSIAYTQLGMHDEAMAYSRRALKDMEDTFGPEHPEVTSAHCVLADLLLDQRKPEAALHEYRRALEQWPLEKWPGDWGAPFCMIGAGQTLIELGRAEEAVGYLEHSIRLLESQDRDPMGLASARSKLARALWLSAGDRERSRRLARAARDVFAELGERAAENLERVESWLATHRETMP